MGDCVRLAPTIAQMVCAMVTNVAWIAEEIAHHVPHHLCSVRMAFTTQTLEKMVLIVTLAVAEYAPVSSCH